MFRFQRTHVCCSCVTSIKAIKNLNTKESKFGTISAEDKDKITQSPYRCSALPLYSHSSLAGSCTRKFRDTKNIFRREDKKKNLISNNFASQWFRESWQQSCKARTVEGRAGGGGYRIVFWQISWQTPWTQVTFHLVPRSVIKKKIYYKEIKSKKY